MGLLGRRAERGMWVGRAEKGVGLKREMWVVSALPPPRPAGKSSGLHGGLERGTPLHANI